MTKAIRFGAVILAAGHSSRMGSFKPLLRMGNSTVLEEAVARFIKKQSWKSIASIRIAANRNRA